MRAEIKDKIVIKFAQKFGPDFYSSINVDLAFKKSQLKDGKITRPCNAFFQFRLFVSEYAYKKKFSIKDEDTLIILSSDQSYLAKVASLLWKRLPSEKKDIFESLYVQAKEYVAETFPHYRYKPNRSKSIWKADAQKKKPRARAAARGNANTNIAEVANITNNSPPMSIDNLNQQMNVGLTFQPSMFSIQNNMVDYFPQVIQNQFDSFFISDYPTSPVSDPEGFPISPISYINNTLYAVPDNLAFHMADFSFDNFN